jgi:hypothetical protein
MIIVTDNFKGLGYENFTLIKHFKFGKWYIMAYLMDRERYIDKYWDTLKNYYKEKVIKFIPSTFGKGRAKGGSGACP